MIQIVSCLSSSVEAAGIRAYLPVFSLNRGRMTHLPSPSYSFGCILRRKANGKARIAALKPSLSLSQVPAKPGEKEKAESKAPVEENPPLSPELKLTNKKPRPWYSPTCSIERRVCEDWHPQWPSYVWATSIFCLTWWGVCRVLPRHPPRDRPHKLPVWMRNKNEHDVTLPSNCVIAELHTTKEIYDNLPDLDKPADTVRCCAGISKPAKGPDQSDFTNDFGYSLFSKEWKDRATCSLYCVVLWCFCLQWDWFWACNQSQTPYKSERQRTIQAKVPTNPPKWLWNCEEALVNTLRRRGDSRVRVSLRFPNCSGL